MPKKEEKKRSKKKKKILFSHTNRKILRKASQILRGGTSACPCHLETMAVRDFDESLLTDSLLL